MDAVRLDQVDDALLDVRARSSVRVGRRSRPSSGSRSCPRRDDDLRSNVLPRGGATILDRRLPPRKRATSSSGRTVADSPMRCAGVSSSCVEPLERQREVGAALGAGDGVHLVDDDRLDLRAASRAPADVSIRNSDSGVVIRMSGGLVISSRRSAGGVSPDRTPTLMSGAGTPQPLGGAAGCRSAARAGCARRRRPAPSAARRRAPGSACASRAVGSDEASRSSAQRNAASVLPDPVGATTSVLSPAAMASHASACAGVGAAKVPVNHSRVGALKRPSGCVDPRVAPLLPR